MALPLTRNTVYAPGAQIKSADLNDIQDKIIAMYPATLVAMNALLRQTVHTRIIGVEAFNIQNGFTLSSAFPYLDLAATTVGTLYCPLPVEVGMRIASVNVVAAAAAVVTNVTASLRYVTAAVGGATPGAETTLVATQNLPAAVTTIQKIPLAAANHVVVADRHYYVRISGANSAGSKQVMRVEFLYDWGP